MATLYLIGTCHEDQKGSQRLEKALNFIRPEKIGIEVTSNILDDAIKLHSQNLKEQAANHYMLSTLVGKDISTNVIQYLHTKGYEAWVPHNYASQNSGTELIPCDIIDKEKMIIEVKNTYGDLVDTSGAINEKFLDFLITTNYNDLQKLIEDAYTKVDNKTISDLNSLTKRDIHAEKIIRTEFAQTNNTMAYIGGVGHIFKKYHNLFERLKDLNPIRIKLNEMDKF